MRGVVKLSTRWLAVGTLFAPLRGSYGELGYGGGGGGDGGGESSGPGGGPPGRSSAGVPPGGGAAGSSDDAESVYCEKDGSSAHYVEILR